MCKIIKEIIRKRKLIKVDEWCDECGTENVITEEGGYCKTCGKFLYPCSMCDMDKVKCSDCWFEKKLKEK